MKTPPEATRPAGPHSGDGFGRSGIISASQPEASRCYSWRCSNLNGNGQPGTGVRRRDDADGSLAGRWPARPIVPEPFVGERHHDLPVRSDTEDLGIGWRWRSAHEGSKRQEPSFALLFCGEYGPSVRLLWPANTCGHSGIGYANIHLSTNGRSRFDNFSATYKLWNHPSSHPGRRSQVT